MKSNPSSWTTFLSSFNPFSAFAAKPTEQSNEESLKEPLLEKQNQNANASAPIKEAPTVSENNAGTQSTTLYSRLVGMFTSWTKEKEPPVKSAENLSPPPSVSGSSRSSKGSVTFGSESSKVLPSEPDIDLGEETTKALKQPNPETKKKSPAKVVVASVSPPVNTYAKAPRAQTENEPRATIKVAEDKPKRINITPSETQSPSNTENSVFETFAQQFVEAKNNVQNTAGTVISEVSSNASVRTQSAVQDLTSLFENMRHPPAGPSVAGINSKASTGPVNNSSKAPGRTPTEGPAGPDNKAVNNDKKNRTSSGQSSNPRSSSGSGSGSIPSSASSYYDLKMQDFDPQTGPRDEKERERAEGDARQESQKALRNKLDAEREAYLENYKNSRMARDSRRVKDELEKSNRGLKSADGRGGPTVHDPRHQTQAEGRGKIKAGEPHNRWATRVTSEGGVYVHVPSSGGGGR